jgi:hypothetical protein
VQPRRRAPEVQLVGDRHEGPHVPKLHETTTVSPSME